MKKEYEVAYQKAAEVVGRLNLVETKAVDLNEIVAVVEELVGCTIQLSAVSFSIINKGIEDLGAMMMTRTNADGKRIAEIVINKDKAREFRRFSLAHELGHLMVQDNLFNCDSKEFVVSTHINYRLSNIDESDAEKCKVLLNEQTANIFALKVLMPDEHLKRLIRLNVGLSEMAKFFMLTVEAVISRIQVIN